MAHKMLSTPDVYLGTFLVLSGFALSLLNLKRILKKSESFSLVLLSENLLLTSIGIAFVIRAVFEISPVNMNMDEVLEKSGNILNSRQDSMNCDFKSVLMGYGPLIVSLVNSFLSLLIDNYMHYRMLQDEKAKNEENTVREVGSTNFQRKIQIKSLFLFWKKNFSIIAVGLQWIVPILMVLSMYPINLKEKFLPMSELRIDNDSCMAMLDVRNITCLQNYTNITLELRKYIPTSINYLEAFELDVNKNNNSEQINKVINNVYNIVANLENNTIMSMNVTSPSLFRRSKLNQKCMRMCYLENKNLLLYMFLLAIVSYFVPITLSTIILTKIQAMNLNKTSLKTYVSRELLYNILFWTPVMFDTFLSLIFCAYSMNGVRTSLFNVIANIYQAVKNFMNTKYFKDNAVAPV